MTGSQDRVGNSRFRGMRIALASMLVAIACSAVARADVVPPPPSDCPDGSTGQSSHIGPYCSPLLCDNDQQCLDGTTCRTLKLCIEVILVEDWWSDVTISIETVVASCENDVPCPRGECLSLQVCATEDSPGTDGSGNTSSTHGTNSSANTGGGGSTGGSQGTDSSKSPDGPNGSAGQDAAKGTTRGCSCAAGTARTHGWLMFLIGAASLLGLRRRRA